jgi:hypothetical protein
VYTVSRTVLRLFPIKKGDIYRDCLLTAAGSPSQIGEGRGVNAGYTLHKHRYFVLPK